MCKLKSILEINLSHHVPSIVLDAQDKIITNAYTAPAKMAA